MLERATGRIAEITALLHQRFKIEGELTTTDENGFISFGTFTLIHETATDIGRLTTSNADETTTQTRVEITSKATGEVRGMGLNNWVKNAYG